MDKKSNDSKAGSSPAPTAAVAIVLPPAFEAHDPSLQGASLALAIQVGEKNPKIVNAAHEFKVAVGTTGEKYLKLLHALREAKLQKKEATALLLGLGFNKGRASELNKLSTAKQEVWDQYAAKGISFRAALALEDGKEPKGTGSDSGNEGGPAKKKEKTKIHPAPKWIQLSLADVAAAWLEKEGGSILKAGARTEYGFTYEAHNRTLYFQVFADRKE